MKLKFTIVIFLLLHNFVSSAQLNQLLGSSSNQSLTSKSGKTAHSGSPKSSKSKNNITGIWRGYFIQKDYNPRTGKFEEDRYKYEVQINNLSNNSLEGVTYSYHTTTFYGKAALQGIFTTETKNIVIKETKMLELKIAGFSEPCLMTCYLDYAKAGKVEILKGEYSSQNMQSKAACGNGTVYLEKVPDTEFEKEDFLLKKTAPTIADKNNTDEISKGSIYSLNNTFPKLSIKPILLFRAAVSMLVSAPFNKAIKNSINTPAEITAATFGMFFLCGSISLFKFNIMITYKNNTMIAPV